MNSKFQYDKKQLPQVIVMGILSLGLFGYFGWKMLAPPPTQAAAPPPAAASAAPGAAGAVGAANSAASVTVAPITDEASVGAPGPEMRDPFMVPAWATAPTATPARSAPAAQPAASAPPAPSLPELAAFHPLPPATAVVTPSPAATGPAAPPAPTGPQWQVTGVLTGDSPDSYLAILRSGDERRYVRTGSMVDGEYRVDSIDGSGVTLVKGSATYRLSLGGQSTAPKHEHVPVPSGADTSDNSVSTTNAMTTLAGDSQLLNASAPSGLR